jgi:hypothetical protein
MVLISMRYSTIAEQKLVGMFGSRGRDFVSSLVVESQAVIKLSLEGVGTFEWKEITKRVEDAGGCWEQSEKVWKIPCFISKLNLPAPTESLNSCRLHVRPKTLQNLIFLHDTFGESPPTSWKDIQAALSCFKPKRNDKANEYSKAECRDYLGALLALKLSRAS